LQVNTTTRMFACLKSFRLCRFPSTPGSLKSGAGAPRASVSWVSAARMRAVTHSHANTNRGKKRFMRQQFQSGSCLNNLSNSIGRNNQIFLRDAQCVPKLSETERGVYAASLSLFSEVALNSNLVDSFTLKRPEGRAPTNRQLQDAPVTLFFAHVRPGHEKWRGQVPRVRGGRNPS